MSCSYGHAVQCEKLTFFKKKTDLVNNNFSASLFTFLVKEFERITVSVLTYSPQKCTKLDTVSCRD